MHDIVGKQCKGIAFDTKLLELFGGWGQYWFRRKWLEDPLHVRPSNCVSILKHILPQLLHQPNILFIINAGLTGAIIGVSPTA